MDIVLGSLYDIELQRRRLQGEGATITLIAEFFPYYRVNFSNLSLL